VTGMPNAPHAHDLMLLVSSRSKRAPKGAPPSSLRSVLSRCNNRCCRLSIAAVGLGVLAQEVAAKTALLIFGAVLVAGVAASAGILLRRPETDTGAKP
jgi:hypothetical protein